MKKYLLVIFGTIILSTNSFSQVLDFKNDKYWLEAGCGFYYKGIIMDGYTTYLSANYLKEENFFKLRYLKFEELNILGHHPSEHFSQFGVLIGKGYSGKFFHYQFAAGLGIVSGTKRGDFLYSYYTQPNGMFLVKEYSADKFITPSIPFEIDLKFIPIKYSGLGICFYGDLNFKKILCGINLKIALGKLR